MTHVETLTDKLIVIINNNNFFFKSGTCNSSPVSEVQAFPATGNRRAGDPEILYSDITAGIPFTYYLIWMKYANIFVFFRLLVPEDKVKFREMETNDRDEKE